ncbi:MAG: alpha/beta hydrolase [Acidimicrobiales bacterium]|jgi:pimeloyl-ACP methyl ester carboxylesterase
MASWVGIGLLVAVCAGCSSPPASPAGGTAPATSIPVNSALPAVAPPAPIVWSTCPAEPSVQCGTVSVPLDYDHPRGASIPLAVTRATALDASHPAGVLVFNPGGPGESGNQILPVALVNLPPAIRQHFDIVTFDPRGTGASDPLRCGTSPSGAVSVGVIPSSSGQPLPGTPFFTAMARACQARASATEPFVDTVNTARDMDRIRQALGVSKISYYGLSYGTVLGAVYADLFPHRVATMVLDGAVDVNASLTRQAEEAAPAEEQSLLHLFATCLQQAPCPLGSDPQAFFTRLAASLTEHPLPAPGHGDTYPVTVGDLDTATLFELSVVQSPHSYYSALLAAQHGDGAPLRTLSLVFDTDIDGAPLVDPLWAITCNDAAAHPGPMAAGGLARTLDARYPLMGAYAVTYTMAGCVSWPSARQPVTDLHPKGTPPIMVIGNTGDPNTPIIGAKHLAAIFPTGSMVTWRGWGHTWLLSGSTDPCMRALVSTYLSGGGLPRSGTVCD